MIYIGSSGTVFVWDNRQASSPGNTDGELQFGYELITQKSNKEPLSCAGTQGIFFIGWHSYSFLGPLASLQRDVFRMKGVNARPQGWKNLSQRSPSPAARKVGETQEHPLLRPPASILNQRPQAAHQRRPARPDRVRHPLDPLHQLKSPHALQNAQPLLHPRRHLPPHSHPRPPTLPRLHSQRH